MIPHPLRHFASFVLALVLGGAPALAGWAGIDDQAGFFSAPAKVSAQREIAELQKTLKKDFAVQTFATIPAEAGPAPAAGDKAAFGRFMEQWAQKQAREKKVNGVYALLVKSPAHLQVVVGNDTLKKAFTLADRDELVNLMLGRLRARDYDGALERGAEFVAARMRAHAGGGAPVAGTASSSSPALPVERAAAAPKSEGGFGWLIPLIVVALGAWLVIGLLRALFRGGSSMAPGMGGGGGFFSSLMGGLFGAAAGMWLYDQFFGHGSSAFGSDAGHGADAQDPGASAYSGEDTDYSGSGGDFGSGDSGGGGSGFGDFGGGGDGGGGGGDF